MTRQPFCAEGTWEGNVMPHTTLWKQRKGYPRTGEYYEGDDGLTYECGQDDDYDRHLGKTVVWKVKQTTPSGQVCPDCGMKVCGVCGYGIDKEGQKNDSCCDSLKVPA